LAEKKIDQPLHIFVYNVLTRETRETFIIPTRAWGGQGILGCKLSFGEDFTIPLTPAQKKEVAESSGIGKFIGRFSISKSKSKLLHRIS
jgi:hypothetical protein